MPFRPRPWRVVPVVCLFLLTSAVPAGQDKPAAKGQAPAYARTTSMIPMRDGVRLHTTVYAPTVRQGALPILLLRTPYGIAEAPGRLFKEYLKEFVEDGYVFVFQDIRGRFESEGTFVMSRPPRDRADPKAIDEGTDAYDTIDWLVKNVPGNNGRVGMLGISYGGLLTMMALLDPHPALKAVSPQASPTDQFLGDDFHHNGAFRLNSGFEYVALMERSKTISQFHFDRRDTFEWYLRLGPLTNVNKTYFHGKMPTWNDFVAHPNYDEFWRKQAVDPYLTRVAVPTLTVAGWWDQEDFYGPLKIYAALERHDEKSQNFLVVGPWNHGGWSAGEGTTLGTVSFGSPTARYFREKVQFPWFGHYLKDRPRPDLPEALLFETGTNRWKNYDRWPPRAAAARKLYFQPGGRLGWEPPAAAAPGYDRYVSDPAKPVPYQPRPISPTFVSAAWKQWLVQDQRFAHARPDVLSYETEPLTEDVTVAGDVVAHLFAATSGTDGDWVVKLIDVYPDDGEPTTAGFQLMIGGEVLRGRFRKSFEAPEPVEAGAVTAYDVGLHWHDHCFKKGHKVQVQVQSTWFPLIDRNPQKYVANIFEAKAADYQAAEQRVYRTDRYPSHLSMQTLGSGN